MIKANEFRNVYDHSKLLSVGIKKSAFDESLKFANQIDKQGGVIITIATYSNRDEVVYVVYYKQG